MQAEYVMLSEAAHEACWLRNLYTKLRMLKEDMPTSSQRHYIVPNTPNMSKKWALLPLEGECWDPYGSGNRVPAHVMGIYDKILLTPKERNIYILQYWKYNR